MLARSICCAHVAESILLLWTLTSSPFCEKGSFARRHGKEAKNAAEMSRFRVVDEETTIAISFETSCSTL